MPRVLALLPHSASAERLRQALVGGPGRSPLCELAFAEAWGDLLCQARARAPDLVVFDPEAAADVAAWEQLAAAAQPTVELLPYGRFDGVRARMLLRLSTLGVREVVIRGQDDEPPALRARVAELLSSRFLDQAEQSLRARFPDELRPLLRHLLANACAPLDPARAARSQFCHPKTLRARLRRAGLPSLNRLIVWTRLFYAAHLLGGSGRSVEQVAQAIGYPSSAAFRAQVHRYAGVNVCELRRADGLERLLARFHAAVERVTALRMSISEL
jgi:AraC-like DNA-binding protein